ncbi:enoyl-[acyl-carrier-protein] reductase (NADH) [Paenibacillus sacheonensis]|nr:enoyl-[acyl-carrier-protein] reductase (NADH) [Paenibacillus sacheonensis]
MGHRLAGKTIVITGVGETAGIAAAITILRQLFSIFGQDG